MNGNSCCLSRNRIEEKMMTSFDANILKTKSMQNIYEPFCWYWVKRRHMLCIEFKLMHADEFILRNFFFEEFLFNFDAKFYDFFEALIKLRQGLCLRIAAFQ